MSEKENENKVNVKKADSGDTVKFERNGMDMNGLVLSVMENAVVVDLKIMPNYEDTGIENYRTVVNHKKYKIIAKN